MYVYYFICTFNGTALTLGDMVPEDSVIETAIGTFLCHNGEPLEILLDGNKQAMSAYDDLMGKNPTG